ncbi:hypothetical protein [Saccharopolyspora phatthalungensis]|uniref:Uncharacterized protein n=1 Tax=Saccharopolyspora phatthalungensis TaxID=664693 RepID=A0A840Q8G3_9PSEU|nr:hypothetical protein [Saccharopolyspora phatthalungensis]MBB5156130.1 hypothetical protein [Saccharopolyspora phatthalungensis]
MRHSPVLLSAALTLAAFAAVPTAPAIAAPANAPVCALFAYQPTREGNILTASGGRTGCLNTATVTVRVVVEQKDAAPKVIGELAQSGTEIKLHTKAPCNTGGTIKVHTETISSTGATAQSPSTTFEKC